MSFLWPMMLWLLLGLPLLVYGYVRLARSRAARRAALGPMGLVHDPKGRALGWRRHVPTAVFLFGVALLVFALARPVATVALPRREGKVILAFDVSNSMLADDLAPTRLRAAQEAARRFVDAQPDTIDIGVVAFSSAGFEVLPPTEARSEVLAAIQRLRPEGATSLAQGIGASLNSLAGRPVVPADSEAAPPSPTTPPGAVDEAPPSDAPRVPFLGSSAVVLLTDGEDTTANDPVAVADVAGRAGVRIFTVGVGSAQGAVIDVGGFRVATTLDEERLRAIASASNGAYYPAERERQLRRVYDSIDLRLTVRGEETEITALLAGAALIVFLVAAWLSFRWLGRAP